MEDKLGERPEVLRLPDLEGRRACVCVCVCVGRGGGGGGGDDGRNVGEYERESSQLKDKCVIRMRRCKSGNK